MKGFIIYPTYKTIDGKAYACLYGRLENGESFLTISYARSYFYIKQSDLKDALNLGKFEHESTDFKDFAGNKVEKIILDIPSDVVALRDSFHQNNIGTYEADIKFPYRFMIDNFLQSSLDIEGSYESSEKVDRVYKEPEIKPASYIPKLKVLSMDIETSLDGRHLYCIGLYSKDYSNVFIIGNKRLNNATLCKNEEELLEKFKEEVLKLDPDVLTGWNMIDFDLKYLQDKFKKHKIDFNLGRDNSSSKIRIEKDFFRDSKAEIAGRQVLDGLHLLKASFIKVEDYKLNTVAYKVLGKRKLLQGDNRHEQIEEYFKKDRQKLVDYNLEDAKLVYEIIEKTGTLDLTIQRSLLTGMPLDRVNASIASLDSLYLKEARKRNLVCPTSNYSSSTERITGGYVMEGKPGIYDHIVVLDFKSLYPSIMRTFNIDPSSHITKKEKDCIIAPNGAMFRNEEGILPKIIQDMAVHREQAKKENNELARYAIKIHLNSMFGVLANPTCRFYNLDIANAITHFGQYLIKLTAQKIEEKGYDVIYEDTDSAFVNSKAKSYEDALLIGKQLQDYINNFYKDYIKTKYKRESHLDLQFDRCFIRFLMPKIRSGEAGAKKRYAGLYLKDGKEDILTVGIESARSDWTDAAQKFQIELLNKIFHKEEVTEFVAKFIKDIQAGKYDSQLVYRKSIRKELEKYTKITPPHVRAARQLDKLEGNIIEYYITEEGPEPIQKLKHKLDYNHYIDKQIRPIADMVLIFFNKEFDDLLQGSKQTKLFEFK